MLPSTTIDTRASNVTGLTVKGAGRCRQLYKNGQRVESKSLAQTCLDFVAWLQREVGEPALLAVHNCFSFDMRVMINQFQLCEQLDELKLVVAGFADTLPALRKALPQRKSYSQPSLFADILGGEYDAHGAVADVLALEKLVAKSLNIPRLFESSASFQSAAVHNTGLCQSSKVAAALRGRISKDHLSASMADKIAKSGLSYHDLELAFQRKGADGLHLLLTEKDDNGKVRVTHSKAVVSKLCKFFASVQLQKAGDQKITAVPCPKKSLPSIVNAREKVMIFLIRSTCPGFMDREFITSLDLNDQSALLILKHQVILLIISGLNMYIHNLPSM